MNPEPANFAHVVYMAVFAVVAIVIFAIVVIAWRSKKVHTPPYTQHPTAQIAPAALGDGLAAKGLARAA